MGQTNEIEKDGNCATNQVMKIGHVTIFEETGLNPAKLAYLGRGTRKN